MPRNDSTQKKTGVAWPCDKDAWKQTSSHAYFIVNSPAADIWWGVTRSVLSRAVESEVPSSDKLPLYFRTFSQHEKFDWYLGAEVQAMPSLAQINLKKLA